MFWKYMHRLANRFVQSWSQLDSVMSEPLFEPVLLEISVSQHVCDILSQLICLDLCFSVRITNVCSAPIASYWCLYVVNATMVMSHGGALLLGLWPSRFPHCVKCPSVLQRAMLSLIQVLGKRQSWACHLNLWLKPAYHGKLLFFNGQVCSIQ